MNNTATTLADLFAKGSSFKGYWKRTSDSKVFAIVTRRKSRPVSPCGNSVGVIEDHDLSTPCVEMVFKGLELVVRDGQ